MYYNVLDVADYVIKYCNDHNMPISNLKLQKILYFIQAAFLSLQGTPCFPDDFVAWNYGPVCPVVYHKYKAFGSSNIFTFDSGVIPGLRKHDQNLLDAMIDKCSHYSAAQLVEFTHNQAPWLQAYSPYNSNVISKSSIKDFFSKN